MLKVSAIKKYYGNDFDSHVLLLDINESKESLLKKVSDFTSHKGTSYIDFIDNKASKDNIVKSYQLLEMNVRKSNDVRLFDIHDMYGETSALFNINLLDVIDFIYNNIWA